MNQYIIFIILGLVALSGCEKEVYLDLKTAPSEYVIEGIIELDSLASIKITKSNGYYDPMDFETIKNAKVILSNNQGQSEELKWDEKALTYPSVLMRGAEGVTYSLSIKVDEYEFTASSKMPQKVEINDLYMYYISGIERAYPMVQFQDIKGDISYYRHTLSINGKRVNLANSVTDSKYRNGFMMDVTLFPIEQDEATNKIKKGDILTTELLCVDQGVYDFFFSWGNQSNPTTNIRGGALGYFSAQTVASKEIKADWTE